MAYDFLYDVSEGVATLTFNRPERLNALTFAVYSQFRDLLAELREDPAVRALVLTGAGRAFCSGGDVHEIIGALLDEDVQAHLAFTRLTGATVGNMRRLEKPIIAAVNGPAAGAGAVIALAADLRVMSAEATLAFLFTRVGLTGADMGAAYLLPRLVGMG
ncbi:MAG: enoyl-CoA hydratase-related protein, partial [Candidatus Promineifilaceae bacterium]